jgi:hypothetical protein
MEWVGHRDSKMLPITFACMTTKLAAKCSGSNFTKPWRVTIGTVRFFGAEGGFLIATASCLAQSLAQFTVPIRVAHSKPLVFKAIPSEPIIEAERAGFEPAVGFYPHAALAKRQRLAITMGLTRNLRQDLKAGAVPDAVPIRNWAAFSPCGRVFHSTSAVPCWF